MTNTILKDYIAQYESKNNAKVNIKWDDAQANFHRSLVDMYEFVPGSPTAAMFILASRVIGATCAAKVRYNPTLVEDVAAIIGNVFYQTTHTNLESSEAVIKDAIASRLQPGVFAGFAAESAEPFNAGEISALSTVGWNIISSIQP